MALKRAKRSRNGSDFALRQPTEQDATGSNPVTRTMLNDPTQFEQVNETCESGRVVLYLENPDMAVFLRLSRQSEYETLKFKPLQIEAENAKARRFEHRCLIWRFC